MAVTGHNYKNNDISKSVSECERIPVCIQNEIYCIYWKREEKVTATYFFFSIGTEHVCVRFMRRLPPCENAPTLHRVQPTCNPKCIM